MTVATPKAARKLQKRFVKENVRVATGFLCPEALEAALPVLAAVNIPVVASGVSEPTLTERRAPAPMAVFRLATSLDKETQATGSFLGSLWRAQPFAVIDDGTIEGRDALHEFSPALKSSNCSRFSPIPIGLASTIRMRWSRGCGAQALPMSMWAASVTIS
jgi:ABC-type branched-subunit amino acid transport system substrate-binding protein